MIVRLLLYLLLFIAVPGGGIAAIWLATRDRRLGRLRAERTCLDADCGGYVDPESNDSLLVGGRWAHRQCMQKLLK